MTDILDELLEQERHDEAVVGSMFSTLQPHVDTWCMDADNADNFESLKGPVEPGYIDIEDVACEEIVVKMTWTELKQWYFNNVDGFRRLLQIMRKAAKKGSIDLERADLESLKDGLRKLDIQAATEGWDFDEYPTTAYDRLAHEFELADVLTTEYRAELISKEKAKRAAYLINVGKLVRKEVIA
jgi:hypothetical protein